MATLYVMCGLPAAGKSTLATDYAARYRAVVLSADDMRVARRPAAEVFAWLHAACVRELVAGRNVVLDVCALRAVERDRWRAVGRRCGVRCECVIVHTPWAVCRARNAARAQPAPVQWTIAVRRMGYALWDVPREDWDHVRIHRPATGEVMA